MKDDKRFENITEDGVIQLHAYKVKLQRGITADTQDPVFEEIVLKFPYIKTSKILAILLGSTTEFKEIIKEYISPDAITIDIADAKMKIVLKALDMLNRNFTETIIEQLNDILNIVLTEYDDDTGKVVKQGNCNMIDPENVKVIMDVVIKDIGDVLKNAFGVGATRKIVSPTRKRKEANPEDQKTETTGDQTELA